MKKMPTILVRDWENGPSLVTAEHHKDCDWVFNGESVPYRKLDGTCCAVINGKLFKRLELRRGSPAPKGFHEVDTDDETGKSVGWVPVGNSPEDQWHREGLESAISSNNGERLDDGTYELVGPKVQGNPENYGVHKMIPHNSPTLKIEEPVPTDFYEIKSWFTGRDLEGIVWHHPDGRMAKIKKKDFGLRRNARG